MRKRIKDVSSGEWKLYTVLLLLPVAMLFGVVVAVPALLCLDPDTMSGGNRMQVELVSSVSVDGQVASGGSGAGLIPDHITKHAKFFRSRNSEYVGILEPARRQRFNFTLFDRFGREIWHMQDFQPYVPGCRVYISNDGKNVISATMGKKTVPYTLRFFRSNGNLIKEYSEYKDADRYDFHMGVSALSPDGSYLIVASSDGVFSFDWEGDLNWEYEFPPVFMRVVHEIRISPDSKYIVLKLDEHHSEESMDVCLYFFDRDGNFIGRYSKEYLHGWDAFSEDSKSFFVASHTHLIVFDSSTARKLWSYKFNEECEYIPALTASPDGKWIALVRVLSESSKILYIFSRTGEAMWSKRFRSSDHDLGDLSYPVARFDSNNSLSLIFPDKVLLFDVTEGGDR